MTEIGVAQIMASFGYDNLTDGGLYQQELQVALAAEEHGYDHIWAVEHHFEDYALCPDNVVYLSHVAALGYRQRAWRGLSPFIRMHPPGVHPARGASLTT